MSQYDPNQSPVPIIGSRQPARRSFNPFGCILGLVITVVIVGSIGIGIYAIFTSLGVNLGPLSNMMNSLAGGPEMRPVSGDASHFDPILSFAEVQELAGADTQIASISAYYVRSDGTMDLNATYTPAPHTVYEFLREVPRPENAPPIGAGGATVGQWYQPVEVNVFKPGQRRRQSTTSNGTRVTLDYVNQGMTRSVDDPTSNLFDLPTSDPICNFADLWAVALEADAPADAVAIIEYDADGYDFSISSVIALRFDHECQLID